MIDVGISDAGCFLLFLENIYLFRIGSVTPAS